ncbi:hypothetical protein DUK53_16030 [Listeria sp. SHR_NRA_18]|uniref:hypothetical protein n=1 Tax=Listeria sp. SHR_NRA_18 TaxID=2269046 RepID=UPI000F5F80BB|nr:hypothetical protein [Listeria sp. SHR_NRA_18]RQW65460.1 hypothetical protein DUK53_16030 [Listeria sp. SHR_NRA_18]
MTQKDRETVNQALGVCRIALAQGVNEDAPIIQAIRIADKLLKEREKAETVFKVFDKGNLSTNFYRRGEYPPFFNITATKGIWIPDVDGEAE